MTLPLLFFETTSLVERTHEKCRLLGKNLANPLRREVELLDQIQMILTCELAVD
jgi:hypothetical protein